MRDQVLHFYGNRVQDINYEHWLGGIDLLVDVLHLVAQTDASLKGNASKRGHFDADVCTRALYSAVCDVFLVLPCDSHCVPLIPEPSRCANISSACPGIMEELRDIRPGTFDHIANLLSDIPKDLVDDVFKLMQSNCIEPAKYLQPAIDSPQQSPVCTKMNTTSILQH